MIRFAAALSLFASPAGAWEFSSDPICTLRHEEGEAQVTVTHDPRRADPYAIAVTTTSPWPDDRIFSMRFDGEQGLTITTDRQNLSEDRKTLTVTDKGFGNVLNGLEFNTTATAIVGDTAIAFALDGAAPEVQSFRACVAAPTA
jgi:hypothetical protein